MPQPTTDTIAKDITGKTPDLIANNLVVKDPYAEGDIEAIEKVHAKRLARAGSGTCPKMAMALQCSVEKAKRSNLQKRKARAEAEAENLAGEMACKKQKTESASLVNVSMPNQSEVGDARSASRTYAVADATDEAMPISSPALDDGLARGRDGRQDVPTWIGQAGKALP